MGATISLNAISHRYKPGAATVLEAIDDQIKISEKIANRPAEVGKVAETNPYLFFLV